MYMLIKDGNVKYVNLDFNTAFPANEILYLYM